MGALRTRRDRAIVTAMLLGGLRRCEVLGLLSDANGFPLMVHAFEGNKAATKTTLPTLRAFLD
ncbi:hypothetical protein [Serinicoccus marinus]|uniref:hypothetical protein n=1 Tax=Serinicoccus marinus TaxID=247333 RepID=UPI0003B58158|nr:hypothetical protein [Serinicoccus marinus]